MTKRYIFAFVIGICSLALFGTIHVAMAVSPADYGLVEGDLISASGSSDPDIYIVNEYGYKRLFLNPTIFNFYGHLKWENVRNVSTQTRDAFITSGLFRNCEANDPKIYGVQTTAEDAGMLHWVNVTSESATAEDPAFFQKTFCVNNQEWSWYLKGDSFSSVGQVPQYARAATSSYQTQIASLAGLERKKRSEHFTIYFHTQDENIMNDLLWFSENDYRTVRSIFKNDAATEILITFSADEYIDVFEASPPWQRDALRSSTDTAGAFCPGCTTVLGSDTEYIYFLRPMRASLAHETAHRFWWATYQNLRRRDDLSWLNEGLAVYTQQEVSQKPAPGGFSSDAFANIIASWQATGESGAPQNRETMDAWIGSSDSVALSRFYDFHGLYILFLAAKLDDYGLARFMFTLNANQNLEQTFQSMFGMSGAQVYSLYRQALNATAATSTEQNFLDVFRQNAKK